MLHLASTLVLFMIAGGLYWRRQPNLHWKFMTAAFLTDLALVLYIELTRHAVETVATQIKPLVWIHAAISTSVLILYVAMIVLGRRLLTTPATNTGVKVDHDPAQTRAMHRNLGMAFCVLRVLNYVTAFMI
jgi:hypothetical protein